MGSSNIQKTPCEGMTEEEIQKYVKEQGVKDTTGDLTKYLKDAPKESSKSTFNPPKEDTDA